MVETEALLRSILYQVEKAESLEEVRSAIRVMCTRDMINAVERELLKRKEHKAQELSTGNSIH